MIPTYPYGKITSTSSAFVTVGGKKYVEPVTYLVGLLNTSGNFTPANVDSTYTFIIDKEKNWGAFDAQKVAWVLVSPLPGSAKQVALGYTHENKTIPLLLSFITPYTQNDDDILMTKLKAEVRRVILANARSFFKDAGVALTGPSYVKWDTMNTHEDRTLKGLTRHFVHIEIHRRWEKI